MLVIVDGVLGEGCLITRYLSRENIHGVWVSKRKLLIVRLVVVLFQT